MTIHLVVNYVTPSLNKTKRQHWAVQYREKCRAWSALLLALRDTERDLSTRMDSPEALRIFSTAYAMLTLYVTTRGVTSRYKQTRSKSRTRRTNEQKSP